jgi:hypothetical protein
MSMRDRRRLALALGAACAILVGAGRAEAAPIWFELGDAGNLADPQFLTGGAYDEIVGSIDFTNPEDAYAFHWTQTGDFSAINLEPVVPDFILLGLYDFTGQIAGAQIGDLAVSAIGMSIPMLAAGDYVLRLTFVPDPGKDPAYRIAIAGPTPDPIAASVPEPPVLLLLACGVFFMVFRSRCTRTWGNHRRTVGAVGVACAILLGAGSAQAAPIWLEVGDAGDLTNPQFLTGGAFDQIVGSLDLIDSEDAYAFHWTQTGDFSAINLEPVVPDFILSSLYDFTGQVAGAQIGSAVSGIGLSLPALAAGDYLLRLLFLPDPGEDDPPYRIAISGSTPDPISAPVPEPSTVMLLAGGIASFALRRRRREA